MTITDLSIQVLPGQKTLLHGYVGLTPEIKLSGVIVFKSSKDCACIMSLYISFKGSLTTKLSVSGSQYDQSFPLYHERTQLLGDGKHPVKTHKGIHSLPFELILKDPWKLSNYNSPLIGKSNDGARLIYELTVEMETLGGLFGGKRHWQTYTEPMDLPCIQLDHVAAAIQPQRVDFDGILNDCVQVHVDLDRHSMVIGSTMNICVDAKGHCVDDMKAELIQSETIHAQGQSRVYDFCIATGTSPHKYKVQDGTLRSSIFLESGHVKTNGKSYKSVDVHSPFAHSLLNISHKILLTITYHSSRGGKETGFLEIPFIVLDLDKDTLEWVAERFFSDAE